MGAGAPDVEVGDALLLLVEREELAPQSRQLFKRGSCLGCDRRDAARSKLLV